MAREDVNIKVSADIAEAVRLWQAMEAGPKGMAREMDALGRRGTTAARGMSGELGRMVGRWASLGAGISAATALLHSFSAAHNVVRERTEEVTMAFDQQLRELRVLADYQRTSKELFEKVHEVAIERRVTPETAGEAAGALLGAGYEPDQVFEGKALDAVLKILAANAATGESTNVEALVNALTGALEASGMDRTADNLLKLGMSIQSIWAATKLGVEDLPVMQPKIANVFSKTGMGVDEQLAYLSMLRDLTTADVASTAWQTGVTRLAGAGGSPQQIERLAELGLTPEDVDFVGESFMEVIERLSEAFKKVGPEAAQRLSTGIFGSEGALFYSTMIGDEAMQKMRARLALKGDTQSFERAVRVIEGGQQAKDNEAAARKSHQSFDPNNIPTDRLRENMRTLLDERGYSPLRQWFEEKLFDLDVWLGVDAQKQLKMRLNDDIHMWRRPEGFRTMGEEVIDRSAPDPIDDDYAPPVRSPRAPGRPAAEVHRDAVGQAPLDVNLRVTLVDQSSNRTLHRAEVHDVGKNAARGGR